MFILNAFLLFFYYYKHKHITSHLNDFNFYTREKKRERGTLVFLKPLNLNLGTYTTLHIIFPFVLVYSLNTKQAHKLKDSIVIVYII